MRIYCPHCKRYIFDIAPGFKVGGPYRSDMLQSPAGRRGFKTNEFQYRRWANAPGHRLPCPSCGNLFVRSDGALLTEHGLIRAGQASVDESVSIVHKGGELDGMLMSSVEWSGEGPPVADEFALPLWAAWDGAGQAEAPAPTLGVAVTENDEREALASVLKAAGEQVHHRTGLAKLRERVAKLRSGKGKRSK